MNRNVHIGICCVWLLAAASWASEPNGGDGDGSAGGTMEIVMGPRHGHAEPMQVGFTHAGGGNVIVTQPSPDTMVVTMTGVVVAGGHPWKDSRGAVRVDLEQCFEVRFDSEKVKNPKLIVTGQVVGLLRSHPHGGVASVALAGVSITSDSCEVARVALPTHSVSCGQNLSINDQQSVSVDYLHPGSYWLRQSFMVTAEHARCLIPCKPASAEFAPDPALDPLWISACEPFHGATKDDFGYQVTIRVSSDP